MSSIFILIPVFKRLEHTIKFIESCNQFIPDSITFVIIDDSPEFEHYQYYFGKKEIVVLKGTGNLWWGGSINLGMEYLFSMNLPDKTIVIWANNDTIIDKSLYEEEKKYLEHNPTAFFHPRVYDTKTKKEVKDCGNLKSWAPLRCRYILNQKEDLAPCNLVSARFLMSYLENYKKVGLIHSYLPHYGGDWDFSLRAEKLSLKTFILKNAICYVDFSPTGLKYEHKIGFLKFLDGLLFNIKSPQNLKFKYYLIKNHNKRLKAGYSITLEFFKTIIKYLAHSFNIKTFPK